MIEKVYLRNFNRSTGILILTYIIMKKSGITLSGLFCMSILIFLLIPSIISMTIRYQIDAQMTQPQQQLQQPQQQLQQPQQQLQQPQQQLQQPQQQLQQPQQQLQQPQQQLQQPQQQLQKKTKNNHNNNSLPCYECACRYLSIWNST